MQFRRRGRAPGQSNMHANLGRWTKEAGSRGAGIIAGFGEMGEAGLLPDFSPHSLSEKSLGDGGSLRLMGAGLKPDISIGGTDELGRKATDNVKALYDFNATILHLLGLDQDRLTYYFNATEGRVTDVHGRVMKEILA